MTAAPRAKIASRLFSGAMLAVALAARGHPMALGDADKVDTVELRIGDRAVRIDTAQRIEGGPLYVNVHENEATSVIVARQLLSDRPGTLVTLHHGGGRMIGFHLSGVYYEFDPNRIYTPGSIERTLRKNGRHNYSDAARDEVQVLSDALLKILLTPSKRLVIALHNNAAQGGYSFRSYLTGQEKKNARSTHAGQGRTSDAFFLVTQEDQYSWLKERGFNVAWQSESPEDDGSLSVWAQRANRPYLNVEAKNGNSAAQHEMLESVQLMCLRIGC